MVFFISSSIKKFSSFSVDAFTLELSPTSPFLPSSPSSPSFTSSFFSSFSSFSPSPNF